MNKVESIKDEQIPPVPQSKRIRLNEENLKRKIGRVRKKPSPFILMWKRVHALFIYSHIAA